VIASVIYRATGARFDLLMRRIVTTPLEIGACYGWACGDGAVGRTVVLYELDGSAIRDDLKGRRLNGPVATLPDTPCDLVSYRPWEKGAIFGPQGGPRISANDLAVVGRLILNRGKYGGSFLSSVSIDTMLQPVWRATATGGY
jgi:CubicO group peptidase (beta-lactamase class C family)